MGNIKVKPDNQTILNTTVLLILPPPINKNPGSKKFGKVKNNKNPEGENFGPRAKRAKKNSTFCGFTRGNRPKTVLFWTKYLKILKSPAQFFLGKWQIIKTPEKNLADFDLKGGGFNINRTVLIGTEDQSATYPCTSGP